MGIVTAIEWADSTLNLEVGCDGCELWNPKVSEKTCYAGQIVERYGGKSAGYPESFDKPKLFPQRLIEAAKWPDLRGRDRPDKPWLNGMPRMVFLDDMGDTFTESLPIDWLAPHLPVMADMPFIFMLLTKRANRMLEFSRTYPFPKNFWLLTSITSAANYNRIDQLIEVEGGSVKGISYEPAWGPIDLSRWIGEPLLPLLQWVISGGSSGPTAKPANPQWFRDVRDWCNIHGVAYFHKQNGEWSPECNGFHKVSSRSYSHKTFSWNRSGEPYNPVSPSIDSFPSTMVYRVGKKVAGRLLDGREWNEFPK